MTDPVRDRPCAKCPSGLLCQSPCFDIRWARRYDLDGDRPTYRGEVRTAREFVAILKEAAEGPYMESYDPEFFERFPFEDWQKKNDPFGAEPWLCANDQEYEKSSEGWRQIAHGNFTPDEELPWQLSEDLQLIAEGAPVSDAVVDDGGAIVSVGDDDVALMPSVGSRGRYVEDLSREAHDAGRICEACLEPFVPREAKNRFCEQPECQARRRALKQRAYRQRKKRGTATPTRRRKRGQASAFEEIAWSPVTTYYATMHEGRRSG